MGQYDFSDEKDEDQNYSASGAGWMVGPYLASRLTDQLIFDARIAWGESHNRLSPFRTYIDEFTTDRWLLKGQFTGDFTIDNWRINPNLALIYLKETANTYHDNFGILIEKQEVSTGRATFGPRLSKPFVTNRDVTITPSFALRGIWDFNTASVMDIHSGALSGARQLRARSEASINARLHNGVIVNFEGFYDGIGADQFEPYGTRISVKFTFE